MTGKKTSESRSLTYISLELLQTNIFRYELIKLICFILYDWQTRFCRRQPYQKHRCIRCKNPFKLQLNMCWSALSTAILVPGTRPVNQSSFVTLHSPSVKWLVTDLAIKEACIQLVFALVFFIFLDDLN